MVVVDKYIKHIIESKFRMAKTWRKGIRHRSGKKIASCGQISSKGDIKKPLWEEEDSPPLERCEKLLAWKHM
jgi:hypothetical protein